VTNVSSRVLEIGFIRLHSNSTQDGTKRREVLEVLGVLDRATHSVRLRAIEPIPGTTRQERIARILDPLTVGVNRNCRIVTGIDVHRETLLRLGFKSVDQCSSKIRNSAKPESTNCLVMYYLTDVVAKIFQPDAIPYLSTPVIQQFLDELSFREMVGHSSLTCFDALLARISVQTQASFSYLYFVISRGKK